MAASVDQTRGNIFLTPLTELATRNSHTVTQNCTASWTTAPKDFSYQMWNIKYIGLYLQTVVYCLLPDVVFQYNMELMKEIALSTCKAKVSVSFRYCTNISCFFSSPSSPSFCSFCGVVGIFWLTSGASSSEPEGRRYKLLKKNNKNWGPIFQNLTGTEEQRIIFPLLLPNYSKLPADAIW